MLREVLCWSAIAVPTAVILIGVAALGFSLLGASETITRAADLLDVLGFGVLQTVAPIAIWVAITTRRPSLRNHLLLEATLFPVAVALVGWMALQAIGGRLWPTHGDALFVSTSAWLGFSWALLAARGVSRRLFRPGG